jgi:hydrophobe/amphiphile efflux-1 (HAE1) family protein
MISRFFIDRPIFAWVIALVIMLGGGLSVISLPVEQYPNIALPQITVTATYQGASAKTVEDSVTQVIEQGMTGLDGLKYISATSSGNGQSQVIITFEAGTDPDIAQVQVQNQVQQVQRRLPTDVQAQGIVVSKASNSQLLTFALYNPDGTLDRSDLGDYIATYLQDPISRVDGVGATQINGSPYAMRIWLDPHRLAAFNLVPNDIIAAIRAQNAQVSAGQIGADPSSSDVGLNATVSAQSRLQTVEQFKAIIIKASALGTPVYLSDVARVELGSDNYGVQGRFNGKVASGLQVRLATGANALTTAEAAKAKFAELARDFPPNIEYAVINDSTTFIKLSIEEVTKTLIEAIILVFIVMYLFLQNWRATLIPTLAVPVVMLGTFGILAAFGFSINTLTMFGLVLAIGLLVDDAIVVVENVERVMSETGLSALEATRKSMEEITGALIGVASVLAAMFIPMAFFGGTQGIIYRQFSITIVSAMALSVVVALVLTPALCATLLKPVKAGYKTKKGFFAGFNRGFDYLNNLYQRSVARIITQPVRWMAVFAAIVAATGLLFVTLPSSFLPEEDQGQLTTIVQLPTGSTTAQTTRALDEVFAHFKADKAVASVFLLSGFNPSGSGQNVGQAIVRLKPFDERKSADMKVKAVAERARKAFAKVRDATLIVTIPPVVRELGNATGFNLQLKDIGGLGHEALLRARRDFIAGANASPLLNSVRANGQDDTPQLKISIDQAQAGAYGVSVTDINAALSTAWGSTYVNDFIDRGRIKRVVVQADADYRMRPEDLGQWYVRNQSGDMVPFSAVGKSDWTFGSPRLERYNGTPSSEMQGSAAEGISSGVALAEVERLLQDLPSGMTYEWSGLSLQERESGSQAPVLYALSLLFVFLLLAALYESWTIPLSVIMVVPLGVLGALSATYLRGLDNDIYFQVGLLTTMGLSAKNAILIVEFAKHLYEKGHGGKPMSLFEATLEAARIRLRPIIMTSLAFGFGIMPLVLANGAGSGAQNAIGTGLLGGIIAATVLAIFFVPLFFVIVQQWLGKKPVKAPANAQRV